MKTCIDTLRESNKQFFTPDDVSPVVGLTAQKIREKAYQGDDLGFVYNCVDCGTGQRKPLQSTNLDHKITGFWFVLSWTI